MRLLVSTVLLLFSVAVYANGENGNNRGFCNGPGDDCNRVHINNRGGHGGDGGEGGDAHQWQVGINKQDQEQYQRQKQYQDQDQDQYQKAIAAQLQKANNEGNHQNLTINSHTDVDAEPAIAPAVAPGDPTSPCIATYGASGAGGGVVSLGFSAYEYDEICGGLEFYRATAGDTNKEVQAMRAATIKATYALLQKKIESELGPDAYAQAVGITPREEDQQEAGLRVVKYDPADGK